MKILKIGSIEPTHPPWPVGQYLECLHCNAKLELESGDSTTGVFGDGPSNGSVIATCVVCGGVAIGGDFTGQVGVDRDIQRPAGI